VSDTPVDIRAFKGLNLREPAGMVQDDELVECVNLNVGRAGELTKRTGFDRLHNGTAFGNVDVKLLGTYQTADHSQILAATSDEKLWYSEDGATWTEIDIGATAFEVQYGVQYVNKFYMVSEEGVHEWDGTTFSETDASAPEGDFCTVYKDRLFVLSTTATNNSRLYFSAIADFTSWPSTNFIDVKPGDGDFLVTCSVIHDLLIIFKTGTTWALYVQGPPENWTLRNTNPEIGCVSKYTPREIEGFLYFVGSRGVYKTDGNVFEDISESIEPVFRDRIVNLTTVNIDASAWWQDRFIVLVHPDPSTYRYLVYHLRTGGWTEWEIAGGNIPAYFLEIDSATPSKGLYAGNKNGTGRVFRHGGGAFTDGGTDFTCKLKTKDFDFALPSIMKRGKWMGIDVDCDDTVDVTYTVDSEELAANTFSATGKRRIHKVPGPGYFRVWALEISNVSNTDFTFYAATLWMHRKRTVIKENT
jgi:hypothetical protein